ncbi:unnamed protein product [Prorocentrum cordatum]|uniref:Uncharacterized protein n=1 Tax=Prorocentrum cordatum TaxID=2364126 RepID=A0ABN9R0U0_9DINO|nr:unnamed protein product [Polarella glacialis]
MRSAVRRGHQDACPLAFGIGPAWTDAAEKLLLGTHGLRKYHEQEPTLVLAMWGSLEYDGCELEVMYNRRKLLSRLWALCSLEALSPQGARSWQQLETIVNSSRSLQHHREENSEDIVGSETRVETWRTHQWTEIETGTVNAVPACEYVGHASRLQLLGATQASEETLERERKFDALAAMKPVARRTDFAPTMSRSLTRSKASSGVRPLPGAFELTRECTDWDAKEKPSRTRKGMGTTAFGLQPGRSPPAGGQASPLRRPRRDVAPVFARTAPAGFTTRASVGSAKAAP